MSEGVFNVVAFGRQTAFATAVAATTVFPVDAGFTGFELNRATEIPDEDFGSTSRNYAGRASHGTRWATASLPFVGRFEDIMHPFEMHVAAISGGTPTGTASPYTYAYTFDESGSDLATALTPYTVEYGVDGSTQDEWQARGVIADTFDFGFDALTAPGNSMWKGTLGLVAPAVIPNALTGTATAPTTLETMEGHLTTFAEGNTSTAFASLSAVTSSLKQFSMRSSNNAAPRIYGSSSDTAASIGRGGKGTVDIDALIAINSTTDTDVFDIFNVSGSPATERRWRLTVTGSGNNSLTIDMRVVFTAVNIGINEDERLYAVTGQAVYDSTLAGRSTFTLQNAVATIP